MGYPLLAHMLELHAYPDQWASDYSEELRVEAAKDVIAPLTPSSFAVSSIAQGIELTWKNPSLNFDGTPCRDLAWIAVYRSTVSGIDPNNPTTYDERKLVQGESYIFNSTNTSQTYYFVITAMDRTGNESAPTSELSATPGEPVSAPTKIPDDATGLIFDDSIGGDGVVSGYGILGIAFKEPDPTWVNFDRYRLWYQYTDDGGTTWYDEGGVAGAWTELTPLPRWGFMHKGLDSTGVKAYRYKAVAVATDGTKSTIADTAGGATTTANATDNSALVAITIFAMNIVALGEVRAENIKVTNLSAINADLGAVTAGSIVVGDSTNKLWLNDAADGGLSIGGTDKTTAPFRVTAAGALTATSATITGALTTDTGSSLDGTYLVDLSVGTAKIADLAVTNAKIADATIQSAKIVSLVADKITGGTITAQTIKLATDATPTKAIIQSANYSAGSAGWQIDSDGNAEFNNVTVRGELHAGANSVLDGGYLVDGTVTYQKLSVAYLSAISADLGTVTAGTIISAVYKTSSSYPYIALNDTSYTDYLIAKDSAGTTRAYLDTDGAFRCHEITVDWAMLVQGPAKLEWNVSSSIEYLSYALTTSWYTWDISHIVGVRVAFVLIRIYNGTGSDHTYAAAPAASNAYWINDGSWSAGTSEARVNNGQYGFLATITDSSGYVYLRSSEDQANANDIYLVAFF